MTGKLIITNVWHCGRQCDVVIEGNRFARIAPSDPSCCHPSTAIDATGLAIVPAFYNAHTHTGMTLMRGAADDMELFRWLREVVWPAEAAMSPETMLLASRLAMMEMIRGGTVFFNDMYWNAAEVAPIVAEMGMRAALGRTYLEDGEGNLTPGSAKAVAAMEGLAAPPRVQWTHCPHAIYTVGEKRLRQIAESAAVSGEMVHVHAAETATEVGDCMKAHGMTPIAWLDACGLLTPKTVLAHAVHLTDGDIALIAERGCAVAHNPCSNFKLASGLMRYDALHCAGVRITLGTDSTCSNNSLSMFDEMKAAAFSAKCEAKDPEAGAAVSVWAAATRTSAACFGLDAGVIEEGRLADAILVKLDHPAMLPSPASDTAMASALVYAADTSVVDTVICDGRVLMLHGQFKTPKLL
ncbi:MAG: amidohydrolase [Kiritimatiellaeota bacterium]|nr:amidohydrolase [Kiritimatiellota bacterium]